MPSPGKSYAVGPAGTSYRIKTKAARRRGHRSHRGRGFASAAAISACRVEIALRMPFGRGSRRFSSACGSCSQTSRTLESRALASTSTGGRITPAFGDPKRAAFLRRPAPVDRQRPALFRRLAVRPAPRLPACAPTRRARSSHPHTARLPLHLRLGKGTSPRGHSPTTFGPPGNGSPLRPLVAAAHSPP
jgi:hypothetical protein